jgi:hypothetical protein
MLVALNQNNHFALQVRESIDDVIDIASATRKSFLAKVGRSAAYESLPKSEGELQVSLKWSSSPPNYDLFYPMAAVNRNRHIWQEKCGRKFPSSRWLSPEKCASECWEVGRFTSTTLNTDGRAGKPQHSIRKELRSSSRFRLTWGRCSIRNGSATIMI